MIIPMVIMGMDKIICNTQIVEITKNQIIILLPIAIVQGNNRIIIRTTIYLIILTIITNTITIHMIIMDNIMMMGWAIIRDNQV